VASGDASWHYDEIGSGRPLVLLHGIGMSHAVWNPVVPFLRERRLIMFDIAGFGATPPLAADRPPTLANLTDGLRASLDAIGLEVPIDIAGNSLGATIALDAARSGLARTVVAISPPGLWRRRPPAHVGVVFSVLRVMARRWPAAMRAAIRTPWSRELALAVPISSGSRHMPAEDALRSVDDLIAARGFEATFEHTSTPFVLHDSGARLTVVFGGRDWLLTPSARRRDQLPVHAIWRQARGWGHVPMWRDSEGVANLILEGTQ
jgi:pimeloyl-ACP methyl ester carboxylesterase